MAEPSPYDQFTAAFNDVEAYLHRNLYGSQDIVVPFKKMLEQFRAKRSRKLLPKTHEELLVLAELRNALTHGRMVNDQRLAEPTATAVDAMRRVRDQFLDPPTVLTVVEQGKPLIIEPDSSVRQALDLMYEHDFSQLPVYQRDTYVGLLTTNTVARWMAAQMRAYDGLAEDVPVEQALRFRENDELVEHAARTTTTTEAMQSFVIGAERGRPLTALIISHAGKPDQRPLAIIVAADLPLLAGD